MVVLDDDHLSFDMDFWPQQYHFSQWVLTVNGQDFRFD